MCCLVFEENSYNLLKKNMPKHGSFVETQMGRGKVVDINPVARRLTIQREDRTRVEISLVEIIADKKPTAKKDSSQSPDAEPSPGTPKQETLEPKNQSNKE